MHPLDTQDFWEVVIDWSRPKKYLNLLEQGSDHDMDAHLYMITGKYSTYQPKLFYIGKIYYQTVSQRLTQQDHQARYNSLVDHHPKHNLYVSHGIVSIEGGRRTTKRIDEIESILIYAMNSAHSVNQKNTFSHAVTTQYLIENRGYKASLAPQIWLGVFIK